MGPLFLEDDLSVWVKTLNNNLKRYPPSADKNLQAWDSADELILQEVEKIDLTNKKILIINDAFGALCTSLKDFDITVYTDSYLSARAIDINSHYQIKSLNLLKDLKGHYDIVLVKIPKNMSFFEDILAHLSYHLHQDSKIICGVMVKHLAKTSFELLEKYIGQTRTSLAQKKARLIFAGFEKAPQTSPFPIEVVLDHSNREFTHHSNLFSREKLDIGTRFFLEHIPQGNFQKILDLGCANGIVGIKAKELNPKATIIFSDESMMAIESAKANYGKYFDDQAEFFWTNCFEDGIDKSIDLILCNPPFHQQHTVSDFVAWQMFKDARRCLVPGGQLRVIGNSHLGYQMKLKKIFKTVKIVATNKKFMIIDAF